MPDISFEEIVDAYSQYSNLYKGMYSQTNSVIQNTNTAVIIIEQPVEEEAAIPTSNDSDMDQSGY